MEKKKKRNTGIGIGIGAGIGLALSLAFGTNTEDPSQYIAYGLAFGVTAGALVDFFNRPK